MISFLRQLNQFKFSRIAIGFFFAALTSIGCRRCCCRLAAWHFASLFVSTITWAPNDAIYESISDSAISQRLRHCSPSTNDNWLPLRRKLCKWIHVEIGRNQIISIPFQRIKIRYPFWAKRAIWRKQFRLFRVCCSGFSSVLMLIFPQHLMDQHLHSVRAKRMLAKIYSIWNRFRSIYSNGEKKSSCQTLTRIAGDAMQMSWSRSPASIGIWVSTSRHHVSFVKYVWSTIRSARALFHTLVRLSLSAHQIGSKWTMESIHVIVHVAAPDIMIYHFSRAQLE